MTDSQYRMLKSEFERVAREINTKELATELLKSEGILNEDGELSDIYREPACR